MTPVPPRWVDIHLGQCPHSTEILNPDFNHFLCFNLRRCAEKVCKLINHPVVRLLGTRVRGTSTEMISQCIYLEFPGSTRRKWFLWHHWDLSTHWRGEKRLSETRRPGFISTVKPDLTQPTHRLEEEDTLGDILFLRLKVSHLHPKYWVFNGSHYALLWVQT